MMNLQELFHFILFVLLMEIHIFRKTNWRKKRKRKQKKNRFHDWKREKNKILLSPESAAPLGFTASFSFVVV